MENIWLENTEDLSGIPAGWEYLKPQARKQIMAKVFMMGADKTKSDGEVLNNLIGFSDRLGWSVCYIVGRHKTNGQWVGYRRALSDYGEVFPDD